MQTVGRLLNIMEILSNSSGMRLKDISEETKLNKSTAHRFLKTLIDQDYVYQDVSNETYHLTFKITKLNQAFLSNFSINTFMKEYLNKLRLEIEETIHFTMFNGDSIVYLDKVEAKNKGITISSYIGKTQPLYSTASGKIFLSYLNKANFDDLWKSLTLQAKTPYTITDKASMLEEIKKIKSQGYSLDYQENEEGIACISCPIYNMENKVIYALSVTLPLISSSNNYKERLLSFFPLLKKYCEDASKKLGHI